MTAIAAAGMALIAPAVAQADTPTATYGGQCGSGYGVIDALNVTGGTVFLTYSSANGGSNCVVTIRNNAGSNVYMQADIRQSGTTAWKPDDNWYSWYAGPVHLYNMSGRCVDWYGSINGYSAGQYWSHCG